MDRPLAFRFVALADRAKSRGRILQGCHARRSFSRSRSSKRNARCCCCLDPEGVRSMLVPDNAEATIISKDGALLAAAPTIREEDAEISRAMNLSGTNLLEQMRQIFTFAGPALGIWLSGPIMSLIDTSVIGTSSSLELAALGPGTVFCDGLYYLFMFLSVATSNLIATSLANKDRTAAANHLARLLFVALACGVAMLVISELSFAAVLRLFVGEKNLALVPAAASYVNIRALAWPAVLVGMVAQSASLGMQDSWSPLKALLVASVVNGAGDILLCTFLGYGIAGAAWATTLSQYVAGFLMLRALKVKDYDPLAVAVPRMKDLALMFEIAAPVLLAIVSRVCFYTAITYYATSLGTITLGAHQVMVGLFFLFSVCGEPLGQTAQSFMPEFISGKNRDMKQAQTLLRSLLVTGAVFGLALAITGSSVALLAPQLFTKDAAIVKEMHLLMLPFSWSILVTPSTLAVEGTLLAGRDYKYLGFGTACGVGCGSVFMLLFHKLGFGLNSCWWILFLFLSARFGLSFRRLNSSKSILRASI